MVVSGPIGILYAPSQVLVAGDPGATAARLVEHEVVVRLGVAAALFCQVSFVFLVLALEHLFDGVSTRHTRLMKALVIAAVPIAITNELLPLAALELATLDEHRELALVALELHADCILIVGLFWGLWLFPFGRLAILSGFIPKVLGWLLIVGCGAYVVDSSLALLAPEVRASVSDVLLLPLAVGELSMVVWLLAKGVTELRVEGR
jgi:hypothetical protein